MIIKRRNMFLYMVVLFVLLVVGGVAGYFNSHNDMSSFDGATQTGLKNNVILISLDALRADHLGIYGYYRKTSPHLDAFADTAVIFDNAYSQSPNTIISHATLMTALHPITHGVRPEYKLREKFVTLAEYMNQQGYQTAGFTTHNLWLNRKMGFAQGFDYFISSDIENTNAKRNNQLVFQWLDNTRDKKFFLFIHYFDIHSDNDKLPYETGTSFDRMFTGGYKGNFTGCRGNICASMLLKLSNSHLKISKNELNDFVESLTEEDLKVSGAELGRVIRTMKYYHYPYTDDILLHPRMLRSYVKLYEKEKEYFNRNIRSFFENLKSKYENIANGKTTVEKLTLSTENVQYIKALYDGGIAYTDHQLGILFKKLKEMNMYDNSLIIITSDHGEEFREHGLMGHAQVYHETIYVPLIMKFPNQKTGKRVNAMTGIIDIMPTILEFARIKYGNVEGNSLFPFLNNTGEANRFVLTTDFIEMGMMLRNHKYSFFSPVKYPGKEEFELYNRKNDPYEKKQYCSTG